MAEDRLSFPDGTFAVLPSDPGVIDQIVARPRGALIDVYVLRQPISGESEQEVVAAFAMETSAFLVSFEGIADMIRGSAPQAPGRNKPCYCGSGRKFKHCHGREL